MKTNGSQTFFVMEMDCKSFSPDKRAEFEVQVLNDDGEAELVAYVGGGSDEVICLLNAYNERVPIESYMVPTAVIEAARRCTPGNGQYVNQCGEIVHPFL